jgi:glutathione peroxidase
MSLFDLFTLKKLPIVKKLRRPVSSIYEIRIKRLDKTEITLSDFKGKKILFVNVASKCGFTKQYSDLQKLHQQYADSLVIIGLPCNQFGYQENGTANEIESFCSLNYGITFPMTEKIEVKGRNQHPIYKWLTSKKQNGAVSSRVKWNFQKYLVNKEGCLQAIFSSNTVPFSDDVINELNKD